MPSQTLFVRALSGVALCTLLGACAENSSHAEDASASGSAKRLQAQEIQSVVAAANPQVQTECWQPALKGRSLEASAEAVTVMAHFTIEPSGRVKDARVDEAPAAYPRLSSCIRGIVEKLTFASSSEPTTVNVPFVLNATETQADVAADGSTRANAHD